MFVTYNMNYSTSLLKRSVLRVLFYTSRWTSSVRKIDKLLVANRGEIACRVIRTAKKLGIQTVAVYSEADRNSLHVALASEAYEIGPPPASQSYLRGEKLLDVARRSGCQAIHPGYGFLSENVEFAESCQQNDLIFIGPPARAIRDMGIKSTSKHIMSNAGVPIIEGYHGEDQSNEHLKNEAQKIGFPIMIKAVRGGGGKGMRIVYRDEDFEEALESARTESQKAFADSIVLLEKFVEEPRHVEVQVFADIYGNVVHLHERDCSVQRRHQKIIEEAPGPGITWDLRRQLGSAAVRAAKAVGYVGAGTVEFILDRKNLNFHFMEMNTRLQVEHPVTEMITGLDLVEWQIKVASGEELPLKQEDIPLLGHSFEARIYAEDPHETFMPGAGKLEYLSSPTPANDVRVETGVRQGDDVSVYYDPMIAKLVVWGHDRQEAIRKLQSKLMEYNIAGLETNVNFLLDLARHPEFQAGNVHTNFIRDNNDTLFKDDTPNTQSLLQATVATELWNRHLETTELISKRDCFSPFLIESNYRINHSHLRYIKLKYRDTEYETQIKFTNCTNNYEVSCDNGRNWSKLSAVLSPTENKNLLKCNMHSHDTIVNTFRNENILAIFDENGRTQYSLPGPSYNLEDEGEVVGGLNKAVAPIPGVLDKILVNVGDTVKRGDSLFVLIAMKMEYVVKATRDARIASISYKVGDNVSKDAVIVQFTD